VRAERVVLALNAWAARLRELRNGFVVMGSDVVATPELPEVLEEEGASPLRPDHAETLFRTEVQRAYGAGREQALHDPEITGAFPLHQYVAIQDNRTRVEHRALHGFLAEPDDPFWIGHSPPWELNCRCDKIPVTRRQVEERGLEASTTVRMPDGTEQDPRQWPTGARFRGLGF